MLVVRRAGGIPSYPLPRRTAEERLRVLRARVGRLEATAARSGWTAELEGEAAGWREEAEAISDALEVIDAVTPALPRCGCGKRAYSSPESAARGARALRTVNERPEQRRVDVYPCRLRRGTTPAWHVGHSDGARRVLDNVDLPISDGPCDSPQKSLTT